MKKLATIAILLLTACTAQPEYKPPPVQPTCWQEAELHIQFFRLCLNQVPEANRVADDLTRCDTVSEIQAIDECTKLGYAP